MCLRSAARRGPTPVRTCKGVLRTSSGTGRLLPVRRRVRPELGLLLSAPVGLAGARHELELAALHALFEDAKSGLLPDVEHLIKGLVRLFDLDRRLRIV